MKRILKYWPEILVFGVIAGILLIDLSPSLTWFNMGADGTAYVMSAKYFYPAHHTSAPLYLLLGHLSEMIPLGTDYWRLALMSAVFAMGGVIFTYLITMKLLENNNRKRLYAIIAGLIYGSSMMLISQAVIAETYTMVTMFSLAAFYFTLKKQWVAVAVMLGLGLATHHLILITWLVLFIFYKEMRNWKRILITGSFLLFYLYIPLSKMFSDQPNMWLNTSISSFFKDNVITFITLIGGVSIWDFPKRLLEMLGFWGICFTIGLIPLVWYVIKQKYWKNPLFWLFLLPFAYYVSDFDPHVSRYALAGVAFGGIIIALALTKLKIQWVWAVGASCVIMLGINGNFFDVGRTLDPNLTATKFYNEEYPKVADGQIFLTMLPGGEWEEAFYYNKMENRHIIPICIGMLPNPLYQDQLKAQGVKLTSSTSMSFLDQQIEIATSIAQLNNDVLITKPTNIYDYSATLVPALSNMSEITDWQNYTVDATWKVKPSNPYDIITGKLELTDWRMLLQSNKSVAFFAGFGAIGLILNWLIFLRSDKKTKTIMVKEK